MDETIRKREKQLKYNADNNIVPYQMQKSIAAIHGQAAVTTMGDRGKQAYTESDHVDIAADPVVKLMTREQLQKAIIRARKDMTKASKDLDFMLAARLRDELVALEEVFKVRYL
jgi:excinuclease ABC subunit B